MCGIAGCVDLSGGASAGQLREMVSSMAGALAHRGPDDFGTWVDESGGIALGHRRLSIIDLSEAGHQPMISPHGGQALVYNGEIYNYQGLKRELESHGTVFRGHADSEVLLEACARWGVRRTLDRLSGMFAFAHWDPRSRRLTLARDHAGMKPLYWGRFGHWLLFGSELKALRRHPAFVAEIDPDALAGFMAFNYVPGTLSIYRNVRKVGMGHFVEIDPTGEPREEAFWRLEDLIDKGARGAVQDPVAAVDELDRQLQGAVARHMVSDVPVASLLSGGIDSSLVTALMQRTSPKPVQSFCVRFDDPEFNEADHARAVAEHLGTRHTEITVDDGMAEQVIGRLPELYDEPFADLSQIPTMGPLHRDWNGRRNGHPLIDMRWIDSETYLPDDILVKVDRASMAAGLEARIPLLDREIIDYAWRLAPELCFRNGTGKWPLRQVLYRYVPREMVDRPKMGFGVPMHTWLRGSLRDWAEDLLEPKCMAAEGLLNPDPIRERWKQHLSGDLNWQYSLWPVLVFQQWLRSGGV